MEKSVSTTRRLALIAVCVSLNLGLGFIVASLKLPFYLDSIGTVISVSLGGLGAGVLVALTSVGVGSIYTPTLWAYALTGIAIAVFTNMAGRAGYLTRIWPTVFGGVALGMISAIVSAPVTAVVWKGASLSGADAVTAFFAATGKTILDSVVIGGLATDPVDKLFTSLIAYALLKRVPRGFSAKP